MPDFGKYFDKLYCINLDKRPDRWENAQKEFEKFDIQNVTRYSAVDGNLLTNTFKLLKGEAGILQTHVSIISEAKYANLSSILIMEDDVYFTNEINNLDEYMALVPKDWDLIYFGGNHVYGPPPIKINDKILKINSTVALHCVAIRDTMFDVILSVIPQMKMQVDGYYSLLQKSFNGYCVTPNIALQREGFSDIQNKIVNYDIFFK